MKYLAAVVAFMSLMYVVVPTAAQTYSSQYDEMSGYYYPQEDGSCEPGMGFVPETDAGYGGVPRCSPAFFEEVLNDTGFDLDGTPVAEDSPCDPGSSLYEGICVPDGTVIYPTVLECLASPWLSSDTLPSGVMMTLWSGASAVVLDYSYAPDWYLVQAEDGTQCYISSLGLEQLYVVEPEVVSPSDEFDDSDDDDITDSDQQLDESQPVVQVNDEEVVEPVRALPTSSTQPQFFLQVGWNQWFS